MKRNSYNRPCVSVAKCKAMSILMTSGIEIQNGGKVSDMTDPKIVF